MNAAQHALLKILLTIQTDGPSWDDAGICANVERGAYEYEEDFAVAISEELQNLFVGFGLDTNYPVDSGDDRDNGEAYGETGYMWDTTTRYGQNRWDLLDRCIKHLIDLE